ncbi:MAG TPA: Flp family type IVb pilin [Bacillota bacterium]|nr:Flp family type IVb pilin [Bacillota bacterium]
MLRHLLLDESAQGMVEYGLLIALISIAVIGAIVSIKGGAIAIFKKAGDAAANPESAQ